MNRPCTVASSVHEVARKSVRQLSWAVAGGLAAWGAARLAGADRVRWLEAPAAPLLSFSPQAAMAALLGSVLFRRKGPAAVSALAGLALGGVMLPRAVRHKQPGAQGPVLAVLTANLLAGQASAAAVVRLVRRTGAEVLFVQELTADARTRLEDAGLSDVLPYQVTDIRDGARGCGIYARFQLSPGLALAPVRNAQPTARMAWPDGQCVELVCVHLAAPLPARSPRRVARWRDELALLPPSADLPCVIAGDFNATSDQAHFRRLLRRGYVDAAHQAGRGLIPTWGPPGKPALLAIDHILADTRCAVLTASVHALPGTDHRAVYAQLRLPVTALAQ